MVEKIVTQSDLRNVLHVEFQSLIIPSLAEITLHGIGLKRYMYHNIV